MKISSFLTPFWFEITKNKDSPWISLEGTIAGQGLQGFKPWVRISQWKRVSQESWNCTPAGDLKLKLGMEVLPQKQMASFFFFFFSFPFYGKEVPGPGVGSELHLGPTPQPWQTLDLSCLCDLHCNLQQHWILNPMSKARDQTPILIETMLGP